MKHRLLLTTLWFLIVGIPLLKGQGDEIDFQNISYVLEGRKFQNYSSPENIFKNEGRVVVEVSVDRSGKVVQAIPGLRGSTTLDENLLRAAREAALQAQFDPNPNAPVIQKGTITYNFVLSSNTTNRPGNITSSSQPNYNPSQISKSRIASDENLLKPVNNEGLQGYIDLKSIVPLSVVLKTIGAQLIDRELKRQKGTFVFADGSVYEGKREKGLAEGNGKRIFPDGSVYEGQFRQGFFEGYGILAEKEQGRYEGNFDKDKREGQGRQIFINNDVYEGNWTNGLQHGQGKCVYKNGSSYEGNWANGKREGKGKVIIPNSFIYDGEWSNDSFHGQGEIRFNNGDVYEGRWENGTMNGFGKLTLSNGEVYDGFWVNGQKCGKGKLTYKEGVTYAGDFFNGKRHGEGKITFPDRTYYKGAWVNDAATGKGEQTSLDGDKYIGSFVNGIMQGEGKLIYKSGRTYEGEWANNKPTGKGKMTYEDGTVYQGDFLNGRKHGIGNYNFEDGSKYYGSWENDLPSGQGTMVYKNGEIYEGGFLNARRHGTAKYIYPDGRVYIGEFANDIPVGNGEIIDKDGNTIEGRWENGKLLTDKPFDYGESQDHEEALIKDNSNNSKVEIDREEAPSASKSVTKRIDYKGHGYYIGEVLNDIPNGKGKLYYPDGKLWYDGQWKDAKFEGQGKMYEKDGKWIYEGGFKNNLMDGNGKFITKDGETTEGVFKEGKAVTSIQSNSPTSGRGTVIRSEELSDNPEKYIGKTITVDLVYTDVLNENYSLRCVNSVEQEKMWSMTGLGIFEDNDKYYSRISDSLSGTKFILRIPYSIRPSVPNTQNSFILVTGVVLNSNTIIVSSIQRLG